MFVNFKFIDHLEFSAFVKVVKNTDFIIMLNYLIISPDCAWCGFRPHVR